MVNVPFITREKQINKVILIDIAKIRPNPNQPRRKFGDDLIGLAESIKQNGIIQPLTVRRTEQGEYQLIAGERRLRAAKMCGLSAAPCVVLEISEKNSAVIAIVENIQRKDLSFFDEAEAVEKLIRLHGITQEEAAGMLGRSQSAIANKLRLLRLSMRVKEKIIEHGLTERHARALLKLENEDDRLEAIETIRKRRLNVEGAERLIGSMIDKNKEIESIKKRSGAFKNIRLFVNTINKAVEMMKAAGIEADSQKTEGKDYIEYVVRIPVK